MVICLEQGADAYGPADGTVSQNLTMIPICGLLIKSINNIKTRDAVDSCMLVMQSSRLTKPIANQGHQKAVVLMAEGSCLTEARCTCP